ncbi:MAG: hypothetical protein QXK55_06540 [Nitrososphaeria archaeon]
MFRISLESLNVFLIWVGTLYALQLEEDAKMLSTLSGHKPMLLSTLS